jgi:hypothetical protein
LRLPPRQWIGAAAGEHVGGATEHERPDDVEAFTREEQRMFVGVCDGPGVGSVDGTAAPVTAALEQQYVLAGTRQLASDARTARAGADDHELVSRHSV